MVFVVALIVTGIAVSAQSAPKIRLIYPTILDRECARITKTEVDSAWVQEASKRTP
jgi:hypothetical protein